MSWATFTPIIGIESIFKKMSRDCSVEAPARRIDGRGVSYITNIHNFIDIIIIMMYIIILLSVLYNTKTYIYIYCMSERIYIVSFTKFRFLKIKICVHDN